MNNEHMLKKNRVAILYIATGRYITFWDLFYRSCEEKFLVDCEKEYFLFTDDEEILIEKSVTKVKQKKIGWPFDTLYRFDFFLSIEKELEKFDYIFYINANTEILKKICLRDIVRIQKRLIFAPQPHLFHLSKKNFPYERNTRSKAFIPHGKGEFYVTGAFNGGKSKNYLEMCKILSNNIKNDLENNIIAIWHDESHINRYCIDNIDDIKILDPYFSKGESEWWKDSKICFLDKTHYRYGGHDYLRGITDKKIDIDEWGVKNSRRTRRIKFRIMQYVKSIFF